MNYLSFQADDFVVDESFQSFHFNLNEDDVAFWEGWIMDHPEKKQEIAEAQKMLTLLAATYQNDTTTWSQGDYQKIRTALVAASSKNSHKQWYISDRGTTAFPWRRLAAIFLLISLSVFAAYYFLEDKEETQYIVKANIGGQKSTIILNDGSKVVLNSESTLKYPEEFKGNSRELILEGEAYFEVAKDKSRPFRVKTEKITTTALGTSFNISAFPEDTTVQVALVTGSVKVSSGDWESPEESLILNPGQAALYDKGNSQLKRDTYNARKVLSWTKDVLYFKDAKFEEIKRKLERWYGVEVEVTGNPELRHFTGAFEDESLVNVLELLSYSKDFKYTISSNKITITFNNP